MKPASLLVLVSFLHLTPALAITGQIEAATRFLTAEAEADAKGNPALPELAAGAPQDAFEPFEAVSPKQEIKIGQSNPLLDEYQTQNGLRVTGQFDQETLDFVQKKQAQLGFNITSTLDLNTWYATYRQSPMWQKQVIQQSLTQWQRVVDAQVASNAPQFIVVNLPTMTLAAYDWDPTVKQATKALVSNVIIGKLSSKTPETAFALWGIKYHPTWTPTGHMLKKDLFKGGKLNTHWLSSHHIEARDANGAKVPYSAIGRVKGLRFTQPAGNNNALGILKFETTSTADIYLHDTNERYLFLRNTRAYSSGCIRVEAFRSLAEWVTEKDSRGLESQLKHPGTRIEKLGHKVPVYFTYSQVYFKAGVPIYAPDIYGRGLQPGHMS